MEKLNLNFQQPFIQSLVSFRNHFNMLTVLKKHSLLSSMLKTVVLLNIFVETVNFSIFLILWWIIFCNIIKVFTVTFD